MTQPTNTPPSDKNHQADFEARLRKARGEPEDSKEGGLQESGAFGVASRLVAELVSGLLVGTGIGWLLDRWLGTAPWLVVVFFVLGAGAGLSNVMRAARQMSAEAAKRQSNGSDGNDAKKS